MQRSQKSHKGELFVSEIKNILKGLLFFKEPKKEDQFILKENSSEGEDSKQSKPENGPAHKKKKNENLLLNRDKRQTQPEDKSGNGSEISTELALNLKYIKQRFSVSINSDFIIREFDIVIKDRVIEAFLCFFDGMVDRKVINDDILRPLMLLSNLDIKGEERDIASYIRSHLLPHNQIKEVTQYDKVVDEINFGGCGIFIDGMDLAFAGDVKGFEHRNVGRPNTELVIRGPQEGFNEIIRVNTALVRKRVKNENLIVENFEIGERSKTPCAMLYIKDLTNESLVNEVRRRLKSIKVDFLNDSGDLEQLIEDNSFLSAPQISATERPDKAASLLNEGKIVVIVNGSPFALTLPVTLQELTHSPEDNYLRFPYAALVRSIRVIGMLAALLLPGIYIAITNYHQEMIPTGLLIAIEASREKVPFPSILEILIMEISFELIREAGIRIPGPIGPTLGIVGALILGQAAVVANIISPILIIIVAVTGIGSFSFPDYSLSFAFRFLRFGYILLGAVSGFLGISTGIFIQGVWLTNAKSFGVPFLAPYGPRTAGSMTDSIIRFPAWKFERRPDYMNTKDEFNQPDISRGWTTNNGEGKKDEE